MTIAATLPDGARAEIVAFDGRRVTLHVARVIAPGTPFDVVAHLGDGAAPLSLKTGAARRRAEGGFEIVARVVDLTRAEAARITRDLAQP
jgi:hypothetical protein